LDTCAKEAGIVAQLIGISDSVKGRQFQLSKERTSIGRNSANDVVIDDPTVSSQHCYIAIRAGHSVIHDLNSTNGTTINGERITEAEIESGQRILIGAIEFDFVAGDEKEGSDVAPENKTAILSNANPPATIPKTFSSVSPLGTKRRENRGIWIILMVALGLSALLGVLYLLKSILSL